MPRSVWLSCTALLLLPAPGRALPVVDGVPFPVVQDNCTRLLRALEQLKAPLPGDTHQALRKALAGGTAKPEAAVAQVQKLLDRHCLIGITINPESRVKAERGPAAAELLKGRPAFVLVKVHNEAGVTHALKVTGPQLRGPDRAEAGWWLTAAVQTEPPLRKTLGGRVLEYVVLRLEAHEAGKWEATLRFDVGQGTQDLGFRAEVPVLFKVGRAGREGTPSRRAN